MTQKREAGEENNTAEDKGKNVRQRILNAIYEMHIYSTFGETMFKGVLYLITWIGAVLCYYQTQTNSQIIGGVIFLYVISYIGEFGMQLNPRNSVYKKIFPFLMILWVGIMLAIGGAMLFNSNIKCKTDTLVWLCFIPLAIYILDFLLYYWVALPQSKLEEKLANMKEKK